MTILCGQCHHPALIGCPACGGWACAWHAGQDPTHCLWCKSDWLSLWEEL